MNVLGASLILSGRCRVQINSPLHKNKSFLIQTQVLHQIAQKRISIMEKRKLKFFQSTTLSQSIQVRFCCHNKWFPILSDLKQQSFYFLVTFKIDTSCQGAFTYIVTQKKGLCTYSHLTVRPPTSLYQETKGQKCCSLADKHLPGGK